jgi:hypothetical protein
MEFHVVNSVFFVLCVLWEEVTSQGRKMPFVRENDCRERRVLDEKVMVNV